MAILTATIPAGQSLSTATDLGQLQLSAIIAPPAWDGNARLSFQLSPDNVAFYEVSGWESGEALTIHCAPGYWIPAVSLNFPKTVFFKIRSGHPLAPVVQTADRVFTLVAV